MTYMVSPCCGRNYSESLDSEGYDIYICDNPRCNQEFSEPIEDYEYEARIREAYLEDRMDERKLNL